MFTDRNNFVRKKGIWESSIKNPRDVGGKCDAIHPHPRALRIRWGWKVKTFFFFFVNERKKYKSLVVFFFFFSYYRSPSWSRKCRMKNVFVSPGMAQWQKKENRFLKFLLHEHFRLLGPTRRNWKKKNTWFFNNSIVFHHSEVLESERRVQECRSCD